jgi:TonB-linked SusC/RagA family outer membrane protein
MLKTAICGRSARGSNRRITKTLLVMRLTIFLLTVTCLQVAASGNAQTVTFQGKNVPLEKVFTAVREQTGYVFLYNEMLLTDARPVTIRAVHLPLIQFLDQLIAGRRLKYTIVSRSIIVSHELAVPDAFDNISPSHLSADIPPHRIFLRVVDADSRPLAGASVTNKRTGETNETDAHGSVVINGSNGDVLTISFIGFGSVDFTITADGYDLARNVIKLKPTMSPLDEIQVIAYGTTVRRLNTADVSTVKSADIERQPVGNPMAALEGRVPGLLITQSSGVPGASFKVQIRGQNSLLQGSDPLFVIDGVPFAPNNTSMNSLYSAVGVDGLSPFNSISPSDIENIVVLKDADATSIYGSRGANGVILINTKKGKAGKTSLSGNVYTGASVIPRTMNMMNTQQYLALRREALQNDGEEPTIDNAPELKAFDTTLYTNYKKTYLGGTAHTTDAQLSVTGGGEGTQFLIGGNYHQESAIYPGDMKDKRLSFHSNISHASSGGRLTVNLSTTYVVDNNHLGQYNFAGTPRLAPNTPLLYDSSGKVRWEQNGVTLENPGIFLLRSYSGNTSNLLGNLTFSYRLLPGLTLKANMGYNTVRLDETSLEPRVARNPADYTTGAAEFASNVFKSWIIEPQAEYIRTIGKGKLNILAGSTWQENVNSSTDIAADGITNDAMLQSISAATSIRGASSYYQYRYSAFFGRIGYNWKDKYLLNLTGRRDGSSRFGPGRQFANLGAGGLAWIFTKEKFSRHLPAFFTFGKLRASYGTSGNDQIGDYQYLDTWSSPFYSYNGQAGLFPSRLANTDYSWEVNRKLEGALELGFLKDRILLNASYFFNRSGNQLISYKLPYQAGFPGIVENFPAEVQNSGLELTLNTKNIQSKNFSWSTSFNLTIHRNKLVKFPGLSTSSYSSSYVVGRSLSLVRGYRYLGVNDTTGIFRFTDVDKDGVISGNDLMILGSQDPKFYGGFQNSFSYKGWLLDVFFEFRRQYGPNYLYGVYNTIYVPGTSNNNLPVSLENRWKKPGDHAVFQQVTQSAGSAAYKAANDFMTSSGTYSDASFIRLKNIALSYSVPDTYVKRANLQACRIYVHIQNLLTITNYEGADPEVKDLFTLPPLRTFTAGIQITL